MAKYVVEDSYKPTYEKNYKIPMINIIPAIVWSIPIHQKFFQDLNGFAVIGLCALFVAAYLVN